MLPQSRGPQPLLGQAVVALIAAALLRCTGGQNLVGWGQVRDIPDPTSEEYFAVLRTDYQMRLQSDYVYYTIDMLLNPCSDLVKSGMLGENCCQFTNIHGCQDVPEINAGPDLQIAYFQNSHIVSCRGTVFEQDPNCGTYIEVHRSFGDTDRVLADVRIDATPLPNGYQTTRIATYQLCMGEHELWWVIRTRAGPYVQKIKKFTVNFPSCASPPGLVEAPESTKGMEGNF